jgi:hypothetical protein
MPPIPPSDSPRDDARQWSEATQLATQIATQLLDDSQQSASEGRDLGKRVSALVRELFVVCDPAEALRQHFEVGVPPFLAVHDLGTGKSRSFLAALSQASGWPLRKLLIRRQGFGTTLATLHYVDCPGQNQHSLRLYASDAEAESTVRIAIRRQLLGSASANALIVEDLSEQVSTLAYSCMRDDLLSRRGTGVSILVLPQARSARLTQDLEALQHAGGARIEVAPATAVVSSNWALLATYWNREIAHSNRADAAMIGQINLGTPGSLPGRKPMPVVGGAGKHAASSTASAVPLSAPTPAAPEVPTLSPAEYLMLVAGRAGASSACIFNVATRAIEAHSGVVPAGDLATQGQALLMSVARAGDGLALGRAVSEITVVLGETQVVVRPVRLRPGCALILLFKRSADPGAWRRELEQIDAALS